MASPGENVAEIFVELGVSTDQIDGLGKEIQSKMGRAVKSMRKVGRRMTQAITAPLAGASAAAVKTAGDFDREFAKISGLVSLEEDVESLKSSVLDLSGETAKSPRELAQALFFVESAGFRGAEALDVLEASAKASAAGLGETKQVADAVTSAVNAYGKENLSATEATDTLVATVREGKVESSELASALGRVIPIASEMGVGFEEVGASVAALTRIGSNARQSVTALSATLRTLLKPTQGAVEKLDEVGLSMANLRERVRGGDIIGVLQDLKAAFDGNTVAMTEVFPNARALRGVLGLVGESAEEAKEIMDSMRDTTGATAQAFDVMSEQSMFQFRQAWQELRAATVEWGRYVGASLTPIMQSLASGLRSLRNLWSELSPAMQRVVGVSVAVVGAMGPVLWAIGALGPAIGTAVGMIGSLIPSLGTLSAAFAALTGPIGLTVAAVTGAAALILTNWNSVVRYFTQGPGAQAWNVAASIAQDFARDVTAIFNSLVGVLTGIFREVKDSVLAVWDVLGESLISSVRSTTRFIAESFVNFGKVVQETFSVLAGILTGDWTQVMNSFLTIAKVGFNQLINILQFLLDSILEVGATLSSVLGLDSFEENIRSAQKAVNEFAKSLKFTFAVAEEVDLTQTGLPSFSVGSTDGGGGGGSSGPGTSGGAGGTGGVGGGDASVAGFQLPSITERIDSLTQSLGEMGARGRQEINSLKDAGDEFASQFSRGFGRVAAQVATFDSRIGSAQDAIHALGEAGKRALQSLIQKLIRATVKAAVLKTIMAVFSGGSSAAGGAFTGVVDPGISGSDILPGAAEGGITPARPTPVMTGEGGQREAIMPLSKLDNMLQSTRNSGPGSVSVEIEPKTTPSGDLMYAIRQGERRRKRTGHSRN